MIGVLGLNGAGKSTLLRIIAGINQDYIGEISMSKGYTVGLLEQEPRLDETKTVIEVVKEAMQPIVEMLARYDEVNAKFAEPDADFDIHFDRSGFFCSSVEMVNQNPETTTEKVDAQCDPQLAISPKLPSMG